MFISFHMMPSRPEVIFMPTTMPAALISMVVLTCVPFVIILPIPVAAIAGLQAFDAPVVLIAGGRGKGLDYAAFADAIAERARAAILIGESADEIASLVGGRVSVRRAATMDDAVAAAAELAQPGDVVLLTPAAASFDMFADYAARGEAFRAAVEAREADR